MRRETTVLFRGCIVSVSLLVGCADPGSTTQDSGLDDAQTADAITVTDSNDVTMDTPFADDASDSATVDVSDGCVSSTDVCMGVACGQTVVDACGRSVRCGPNPCALDAPVLIAPHNGKNTGRAGSVNNPLQGTSLRPIFRWNPVVGAARYEVQWTSSCTTPGFDACTFANATMQSSTTNTLQPAADLAVSATPPVGSRYYWRVRACTDAVNCSAWSSVRYLNVGRADNDFNGDGYSDIAIGAVMADFGSRTNAGSVSVYAGSAAGVSSSPTIVLEGASRNDWFGYSSSGAGDVNADGFCDLVVGAPQTTPSGKPLAGTAYVYHGTPRGLIATPSSTLEGATGNDWFGNSVSSAGDVNADGFSDIVVGAYKADPGFRSGAGSASVFHGGVAGVGTTPARVIEGTNADDNLGGSVASAGDVNADGFSDIVLGAMNADPLGRISAGTASVFLGSRMGIPMTPARILEGPAATDNFGSTVECAGDVNADGYSDIVVGAYQADVLTRIAAGTVAVFLGSNAGVGATPSRRLEGIAARDTLGSSAASAGDVNGDGYSDLVAGAMNADPGGRSAAGTASLWLGSSAGIAITPSRTLEGQNPDDTFGSDVGSAGDVNADGYSDMLVAAFQASPGGRTTAGTVSLFQGSATGLGASATRVFEGVSTGDYFGHSLAMRSPLRSTPVRARRCVARR